MRKQIAYITFTEIVFILLLIILAKVITKPWAAASKKIFYSCTGYKEDSTWAALFFALVTFFAIIGLLLLLERLELVPGGVRGHFIKEN